MRLFDAHCHLQDERIIGDIEGIMNRAAAAGIENISCCGTAPSDWTAVRDIAAAHPSVVPSYGLHPWFIEDAADGWHDDLKLLLSQDPSAGLGEAGLDHGIDLRNDSQQEQVFRLQLELARELARPVSIHCRRAWGALLPILTEYGPFEAGFVVHSYSGSRETMEEIFRLNGYVSFSGTITRSGNKRGRKCAEAAPLDRLLLETDAPDMLPVMRDRPDQDTDKPNEPAFMTYAAESVAELRGISPQELAEAAYENAERLFLR